MSEPQAQARHALHWLPNALTVSRILLIPVLVWALLSDGALKMGVGATSAKFIWALVLFIYCILTDFFDGLLARKLNIASDFGRMLDPIADKLLVATCLIAICILIIKNPLLLIPTLTIIGRDIFVSGIREHAANSNIILSPTKLAKWKTALEMLAILLFLLFFAYMTNGSFYLDGGLTVNNEPIERLGYIYKAATGTLCLAAILSAYTGFHYFRSAMKGKATS